eukprot:Lithocolla_globosa_v1_NODE_2707_length_1898_cov_11.283776.p3 type:complete len:119 gc:universal NODE_2707_length_1898_cov_11.283776:1342-986(-)
MLLSGAVHHLNCDFLIGLLDRRGFTLPSHLATKATNYKLKRVTWHLTCQKEHVLSEKEAFILLFLVGSRTKDLHYIHRNWTLACFVWVFLFLFCFLFGVLLFFHHIRSVFFDGSNGLL